MPKVSVIIPSYNRKDTLGEAIDSVLNQTFRDFEIIVVDHGSTDGTFEWAARAYPTQIRLIRLDYCPLPACPRNRGIQEAKGDYVAFLDSDDLWLPKKLALQMEAFAAHPKAGWSYGMAERFGDTVPKGTPDIAQWQVHTGQVFEELLLGNFIPTATMMIRKSLLDTVGIFDQAPELRSTEDYELWLRLAAQSPVCAIGETIARIRIASDNVSGNLRSRFDPELKALESAQRKLNVPPEKMRRAIAALHLRHFRYLLEGDSQNARAHLDASWALQPLRFRTALYKALMTVGGATAAKPVIAAEKWLKRCLG